MNRYQISWEPDAIDAIAEIWLAAVDRRAITDACNAVEARLAVSSATQGESLHEGLRKINLGPLAVVFSVEEENWLTRIESVSRL